MNPGWSTKATIKANAVLKNLDQHFDLTTFVAAPPLLTWFDVIGYTVMLGGDISSSKCQTGKSDSEVVLSERLSNALRQINSRVSDEAIAAVIDLITYKNNWNLPSNNLWFHKLLITGVDVTYQRHNQTVHEKVWLIDWLNPLNNDWLVVHQFTVNKGSYSQSIDVVVLINGLPLAVMVCNHSYDQKAILKASYQQLQTYLQKLPQLFIYNTFLIAACGNRARVGTITSTWEEFLPWHTIDGEDFPLPGETQLEVLIQGVFDKRRFLELLKYFIVFEENTNSIHKKLLRHRFCTTMYRQNCAEMGGNHKF